MFSRFLIAVAAAAVVLGGSVCANAAEVLNFGIISTESSQNLKQLWDPFLADMEKATGFKVKAFFASDYAGIIEGMRFKKVDLCWIGNKGAIQMVDRSDGSVFAQTTAADGTDGYYSLLVVNKESPLKSVDDVLKNAAELRFSNGDPNSTSGFLVPGYYVFAKNNVDPKKIFKNVVAANHESNALAVANRQVDVATCNNEAIGRLEIAHPEKAAQIREIWRSPLIPSDPLVWRNSLPESTKKKIADFIFGYGVKGDVAHAKAILEKLQWGPFKPSTNAQLVPLRQLELFREKSRLEANAEMPAAETKIQFFKDSNSSLFTVHSDSVPLIICVISTSVTESAIEIGLSEAEFGPDVPQAASVKRKPSVKNRISCFFMTNNLHKT